MRQSLPAWLVRLLLVTSSLWACNTLTGADNLTVVEAAGAKGAASAGAGDSGGTGGSDNGNGGSSGDDDDNNGGGGGSGGSGGSGSNIACSSTTETHDECRSCCRSERRGTDKPLEADVVAAIEQCVCESGPDCSGLSGDCAACCQGICAGQSSIDSTFSAKCTQCVSGLTCPGLSNVCNQQPRACTALFGCFHECQDIEP
ncbi:MAG: hypothetical protein MUF34_00400 [Polyangiaceae bacterium]|jgi:hypothetical protein|nr:hypothetical protein [Polyangiaceae bacterium]